VAGLHALLLLGTWPLPAWQDRDAAAPAPAQAQAPLIVWLQGAPPPGAARPPAVPAARQPLPAMPALRPVPALPAAPASLQSITLPAEMPAPEPVTQPAPIQTPASTPPPPAPAPLNLALPRGASAPWRRANPALDDPRSNSTQPTLESRIAAALGGTDQITEYRLEDGSLRLKRGNSCVILRPNRSSMLEPFSASAQQRPRLADRC